MKNLFLFIIMILQITVFGQKKQPSLAVHYSFTDFQTAMKIKANGFGPVLKNGQWSNLPMMDAGYGISYWQGISRHLDINGLINYTKSIYTFPVSGYSVTQKLLTLEANGIYKFIAEDKAAVTPYLSAGLGLYSNAGKTGFYAPLGLGAHINLWDQAFVFAGTSYRVALAKSDNKNIFYQIGVGTNLIHKKEKKPLPPPPPPVVVAPPVAPVTKTVAVWVKDEATYLPLPDVDVKLTGADGKTYSGKTDSDGKVNIPDVAKENYGVSGILNNIVTQSKNLEQALFDTKNDAIDIILLHNDPRFTLSGKAVDKKGGNPVGNVDVTVVNATQNKTQAVKTGTDGLFKVQLEQGSDFSVSGKKASYFSNIEKVSTKGLNRSTTLYVKLELEIQPAKAGQQFVLNNIFFSTNKADLNTAASSDLNRLVKYLQDNPSVRLEIQGHTDNKGNDVLNNRLSQNRATSVLNYLVGQGISSTRLTAKGFGSKNPIDTNTTEQGRANNRRVEVKILGE